MGHCIDVYLINKSELRDDKISSVIDNKADSSIIWTDLKEGVLATTYIKDIREYGRGKTIAKISTDYFGGMGHQTAKLFVDNKKVYDSSDEFSVINNAAKNVEGEPINSVLKMIGVVAKTGLDEYDTIGLSNYRSNEDFKNG